MVSRVRRTGDDGLRDGGGGANMSAALFEPKVPDHAEGVNVVLMFSSLRLLLEEPNMSSLRGKVKLRLERQQRISELYVE